MYINCIYFLTNIHWNDKIAFLVSKKNTSQVQGSSRKWTEVPGSLGGESHPKPLGKMSFLSLQKWWDMLVLYYRVALVSLGATIGS